MEEETKRRKNRENYENKQSYNSIPRSSYTFSDMKENSQIMFFESNEIEDLKYNLFLLNGREQYSFPNCIVNFTQVSERLHLHYYVCLSIISKIILTICG